MFGSGAIATVEATWMIPEGTGLANGDTFSVVGTRGAAQIDMGAPGLRLVLPGQMQVPDTGYEPLIQGGGGALRAELAHFAQLAQRPDLPPVVTVDDGVRAVIVAEALIASARENREIRIDWPPGLETAGQARGTDSLSDRDGAGSA